MTHPSYNGQDLRARAAKLQREYALRFVCGTSTGVRGPDFGKLREAMEEVGVLYFRHLDGQEDAKISCPQVGIEWTVNVCAAANCCRSENGRPA